MAWNSLSVHISDSCRSQYPRGQRTTRCTALQWLQVVFVAGTCSAVPGCGGCERVAPAPARINSTYGTTDGLTDRVTASWTHGLTDRRTKIDEKTGGLCPGEARNFGKEAGPKPQDSMFTDSSGGLRGTKVCRYNWHSAGSLGWPFPMLNNNNHLTASFPGQPG